MIFPASAGALYSFPVNCLATCRVNARTPSPGVFQLSLH